MLGGALLGLRVRPLTDELLWVAGAAVLAVPVPAVAAPRGTQAARVERMLVEDNCLLKRLPPQSALDLRCVCCDRGCCALMRHSPSARLPTLSPAMVARVCVCACACSA